MKSLVSLIAVLIASLTVASAQIITASSSIQTGSFIEFNSDPNTATGPDYSYSWVADGESLWIDGEYYAGPCWYFIEFDYDWNTVQQIVVPGYSITLVQDIPLAFGKVNGVHYFTWSDFLSAWVSAGGTYSEPAKAVVLKKRGKGHSK